MGWAYLFLLALAAPSARGQSCSSNGDCSGGDVCGYSQVDGTADRVCCPETVRQYVGRNEYGFTGSGTGRYFCTDQPDGTKCGAFDDVCSSGACVLETCQDEKLDANEVCKTSNDCSSAACAYGSVDGATDPVCCESGNTVRQYVGRNEYGFTGSGTGRYFCTDQPDGTKCGAFDDVCSSGACVLETCRDQKLGADEVCKTSNDCESSACAYGSVDGSTDPVCCGSGSTFRQYIGRNEYGFTGSGTGRYFCTERPDGTRCGAFDDMCASGLCVCGACEEEGFVCETGICGPDGCLSELLQPGAECIADNNCILGECGDDGACAYLEDLASCTEGLDSQCGSQACAREKAEQDAEFVCCSSGAKLVEEELSLQVCTQGSVPGDSCFSDIICKSSICVEGECNGGLQKEGEPCERDGHCHSDDCSGSECAPFPTLEERNSYFNARAVCPIATLDNSDAGGFVALRVFGDSTSRSWSSQLFDEVRDEKRDATGTENVLEGRKVLDALEGCADGSAITAQRQGDSVCFSYQFQDVGDDGTDSSCKSECIRFGGSRSLETYDKLTTNVVGGLFGQPVIAYYFGENRKCRIEVSMEQTTPADAASENGAAGGGGSDSEESSSPTAGGDPDQDDNEVYGVETALPTESPTGSSTASSPTRSPLIAPFPASVAEIVVDGEGDDSDEGAGSLVDDPASVAEVAVNGEGDDSNEGAGPPVGSSFANDANVGDSGNGEGEESIGPTIDGEQQLPEKDANEGLPTALETIASLIADGEGDDSDEGVGPLLEDDSANDANVGGSGAGEGEESAGPTIVGEQQSIDGDGSEGLSAASEASQGAAQRGGLLHWKSAIALTGLTWMFA